MSARLVDVWEAGFDAGVDCGLGSPDMPSRDDGVVLWRAGWMSGSKARLLLAKPGVDEHTHQTILFRWADAIAPLLPELQWMYAIPNAGKRGPVAAARLKQEGMKRGVPDICLPVARMGFGSLYIELKTDSGSPTKVQTEWIDGLCAIGSRAVVRHGWREARAEVRNYLLGRL